MTTAEEYESFRAAVAGERDLYHRVPTERADDRALLLEEVHRCSPLSS